MTCQKRIPRQDCDFSMKCRALRAPMKVCDVIDYTAEPCDRSLKVFKVLMKPNIQFSCYFASLQLPFSYAADDTRPSDEPQKANESDDRKYRSGVQ